MSRHFIIPAVATILLAGVALADSSSSPSSTDQPAATQGTPGQDGGKHWHHHHRFGMMRHDPLAALPKPLTADAVKQALDDAFSKRPQVKSVTQTEPNILRVEIQMPDGNVRTFEINETTGARRPAW